MSEKRIITARDLAALKPGEWASDPAARGEGRFQARKLKRGTVFLYYRYVAPSGERERISLGSYDPEGIAGLTLAQGRDKAREWLTRYRNGERDLRALKKKAERAKTAAKQAADDAENARKAEAAQTFGALLLAYADSLALQGKSSAHATRLALQKNVERAHPTLWAKPASAIDADDVLDTIETLAAAGSAREAGKLRAYIRAAFQAAINARTKPGALAALRKFKLKTNPARDVGTVPGASKARDRALSLAELRAYWQRICALPEPASAMMRFHLLTGAQRIEQLARVTVPDIDQDSRAMLILDAKGRRAEARRHWVPLTDAALACIDAMRKPAAGDFVWSMTCGLDPLSESTFRDRVASVCDAMLDAGEAKERFTPGDLRRSVETRLAAAGVSLEVRAQLQSHGLGGLQARHYDRHRYSDEKRAALEKLHELLTGKAATGHNRRARKGAK